MKVLIPLAAYLACLDGVSTDYRTPLTLRSLVEASLELETKRLTLERDGQPPYDGGGGGSIREDRRVEETFRVLEHAEGAPTKVRRAFETVGRKTTSAFGLRFEEEQESPLWGVTLELTLEDGLVLVEVVDGESPDQETALQGHGLTLACDGLLPAYDAQVDATWELDADAILRALALDLEDAYFPTAESPEADLAAVSSWIWPAGKQPSAFRSLAAADWTGKATVIGEIELDGIACIEIDLQLEAAGAMQAPSYGRRGNTVEAKLAGRLLFAKKERLPVLLELGGQVSTMLSNELEHGQGKVIAHSEQEGTFTYRARLSVEQGG